MAIIDSLLSFQTEARILGNMLEFGVYKGRSAALIGRHLALGQRLVLVDIAEYLEQKAIAPFRDATDFVVMPTEKFKNNYRGYAGLRRACRFIHIDASHAYRATFTELQMADELLADRGIISMDDYTNLNYSANIAAIFKYLYTSGTDLQMFLVTNEKAYLCRKKDLPLYGAFVLDRLIAEMRSRGVEDVCLSRTDADPDYRAFYARSKLSHEEDNFYGLQIYRRFYLQP